MSDDAQRLADGTHDRPHDFLGPHLVDGATVVRCFRPASLSVRVRSDDGAFDVPAVRLHESGVYEARLPPGARAERYKLTVTYPNGTYSLRDAYSFPHSVGPVDLHLLAEGTHGRAHDALGAHVRELHGVRGVAFAVWAPEATRVSVVGDFTEWDGRLYPMSRHARSGVWEVFVPELPAGSAYKFELRTRAGLVALKADPFAFRCEEPPQTASIVETSSYRFTDAAWMKARAKKAARPITIYEVHLGSWRRVLEEGRRPLTYRELAPALAAHVKDLGFTHVEMLPVMEHPFGGSWGYQVTGYFAPTARWGTPDDFRFLVDHLHGEGIGVLLDWVPAHFPRDAWALARFDGTAVFEHLDPRLGEHPDWGTLLFNYGRPEVKSFLLSSARYWIEDMHADGIRVDAVASMLYLDYSRKQGEWLPNRHGGRENLDAIAFLRELDDAIHTACPGAIVMAEESTAWPAVTHPTYVGGLGFDLKWNMGWMHDTLDYFKQDPIHRRYHHHRLTFGMMYAYSEKFLLPLSHDEVVHLKGSLLRKMPGDAAQRFANLRALYAYQWSHPGKKLLFMGGELAQEREWDHDGSIDWHLLELPAHAGVQRLVRDLNRLHRAHPGFWEDDDQPSGFQWIDVNNADANVVAFMRVAASGDCVVCVGNFSGKVQERYRIGLPHAGVYSELLNTDATDYGGRGVGNMGTVKAVAEPFHGQPFSAEITLPALSMIWLA